MMEESSVENNSITENNNNNSSTENNSNNNSNSTENNNNNNNSIENNNNSINQANELVDNEMQNQEQNNEINQTSVIYKPFPITYFREKKVNTLATTTKTEYKQGNFLKGIKWSPDGSCLLSLSDDNTLRLFNTPPELFNINESPNQEIKNLSLDSVLKVTEAELVYDFNWYPYMNSFIPESCCFVTCARDQPIHLWDAFNGNLRASYRCYNQADELVAPFSVCFNTTGEKIYSGTEKLIRVFDVSRPGRDYTEFTIAKKRKRNGFEGQPGILSCLSFSKTSTNMFAAGSYQGYIALYDERTTQSFWAYSLPKGVTQITLSDDGVYLFAGCRKSSDIFCFDTRALDSPLFSCQRVAATNQRIQFDINYESSVLVSGSTDGNIRVFDLNSNGECVSTLPLSCDSINGVSLHPILPIFAVSSGERLFPNSFDINKEEEEEEEEEEEVNVVEEKNTSLDANGITKPLLDHHNISILQMC